MMGSFLSGNGDGNDAEYLEVEDRDYDGGALVGSGFTEGRGRVDRRYERARVDISEDAATRCLPLLGREFSTSSAMAIETAALYDLWVYVFSINRINALSLGLQEAASILPDLLSSCGLLLGPQLGAFQASSEDVPSVATAAAAAAAAHADGGRQQVLAKGEGGGGSLAMRRLQIAQRLLEWMERRMTPRQLRQYDHRQLCTLTSVFRRLVQMWYEDSTLAQLSCGATPFLNRAFPTQLGLKVFAMLKDGVSLVSLPQSQSGKVLCDEPFRSSVATTASKQQWKRGGRGREKREELGLVFPRFQFGTLKAERGETRTPQEAMAATAQPRANTFLMSRRSCTR